MNNVIRWVAALLMLCLMAVLIATPAAMAEDELTPLPLDQTVPGRMPLKECWDGENYSDDSITITTEHTVVDKQKSVIVRIKITDPTQMRTAMSQDDFKKGGYAPATSMAKHVNAVVAVNGDFFKYYAKSMNFAYTIRQGVTYSTTFSKKHVRDLLLIDDKGDFWGVKRADDARMKEFYDEVLPEDRSIINTFLLGPILVQDGAVQDIDETVKISGEFQYKYRQQRVAIVQLGELEYAIVEVDGKTNDNKYGITLYDFANYIADLFPDCWMAYNLDGGGSTNVIVNNKRIHTTSGLRDICDILYFATLVGE